MRGRIDGVPAANGRDWPTVVALVAVVVAFGVAAGPLGAFAGLATALVGVLLGAPYALAAGHVALVGVFPGAIGLDSFVVVEVAFATLLVAPLGRTASPVRISLVAIASALALAGTAWLVGGSQSIPVAAAAVLCLLATAAYGLHRLELVRLGLVSTDDGVGPRSPAETTAESHAEPTPESQTEPIDTA
ncbi:hypothetical protein [Natrinema salaciae]|uniref:DUF8163 domain-containing protein n=1 Tax=Natrinema salaciae TaxID=1186196 RepID=A0A1H9BX88_9EURY|nr:hypothetical protein [Natrinema salaciae]SEP93351.1 hypothetical protein SAMN04489841_0881 [Natrinema salaciae]